MLSRKSCVSNFKSSEIAEYAFKVLLMTKETLHTQLKTCTVEPQFSVPQLSRFLDYPDFLPSPNFIMNIY